MLNERDLRAGRRRIAIVEDDGSMALLLAYNLEAAGYDVSIVSSGIGALDNVERIWPQLMILDWELPGLSGIEVLRQIRRRLATAYMPVVMLTGRKGFHDRKRAIDTGADVFLSKPFSMCELMHHVTMLLERHGDGTETWPVVRDRINSRG